MFNLSKMQTQNRNNIFNHVSISLDSDFTDRLQTQTLNMYIFKENMFNMPIDANIYQTWLNLASNRKRKQNGNLMAGNKFRHQSAKKQEQIDKKKKFKTKELRYLT